MNDPLFSINGVDPVRYYTPLADVTVFSRVYLACNHQFVFRFNWRNNVGVIAGLHNVWIDEVREHARGHAR